jgi:rhodanese-related sulfurtransferase
MDKETLRALLAGSHDHIMLLDVREPDEIAQDDGIAGSVTIPLAQALGEVVMETLPKDKKIITICKGGVRADKVTQELLKHGYDAVTLQGGLIEWHKK